MKKWIIGVVAAILALALVAGGAALAAFRVSRLGETDTSPALGFWPSLGRHWDGEGFGPMMGGGLRDRGDGQLQSYLVKALAEGLGISETDLESRQADGETWVAIAQAQGLTDEEIQTLWQDARQQALDAAVADGVLTQAQADGMIEHMDSRRPGLDCPMMDGDEVFGFGRGRGTGWRFFEPPPEQP